MQSAANTFTIHQIDLDHKCCDQVSASVQLSHFYRRSRSHTTMRAWYVCWVVIIVNLMAPATKAQCASGSAASLFEDDHGLIEISPGTDKSIPCVVVIHPLNGAEFIDLILAQYAPAASSIVEIFDDSSQNTLLWSWTDVPSMSQAVRSSNGSMSVRWTCNSVNCPTSLHLLYRTHGGTSSAQCAGHTAFTGAHALIEDGSGTGPYLCNVTCEWNLASPFDIDLSLHLLDLGANATLSVFRDDDLDPHWVADSTTDVCTIDTPLIKG